MQATWKVGEDLCVTPYMYYFKKKDSVLEVIYFFAIVLIYKQTAYNGVWH